MGSTAVGRKGNHLAAEVYGRKATIIASSDELRTVELGSVGPVLRSSNVSRLRHLATVLTLMPSSRLSAAVVACDRYIVALIACVVVAQP